MSDFCLAQVGKGKTSFIPRIIRALLDEENHAMTIIIVWHCGQHIDFENMEIVEEYNDYSGKCATIGLGGRHSCFKVGMEYSVETEVL